MPEYRPREVFAMVNGVNALNGKIISDPIPGQEILNIASAETMDVAETTWFRNLVEEARYQPITALTDFDPLIVEEAGWGVIFPEKADPALRAALSELLNWREVQARNQFKVLSYRPGESHFQFLSRYNVDPNARPDPSKIPYYLLIAGSPGDIPFAFENALGYRYAVGRLYFDRPEDFARYARTVVEAEQLSLTLPKKVGFFSPVHIDDLVLDAGTDLLAKRLLGRSSKQQAWETALVSGVEADKGRLLELTTAKDSPAILFYTGHGIIFPRDNPDQEQLQGSLACAYTRGQIKGKALPPEAYLSAGDLNEDDSVLGKVIFLLSSYALGTPPDRWDFGAGHNKRQRYSARPFVAALPQQLLAHPRGGALAVIGPNDLSWNTASGLIANILDSSLRYLMNGSPVGHAVIPLKKYAAEIIDSFNRFYQTEGPAKIADDLTEQWLAKEVTRSMAVFGDPAVRLRTSQSVDEINQQSIAERLSVELSKISVQSVQTSQVAVEIPVVPELPKPLIEALNQRRCVVFLGSRLSEQGGYLTKQELARRLLQWGILNNGLKDQIYINEIQRMITRGDANLAIDGLVARLKENLGSQALWKFFIETYQRSEKPLPKVLTLLKELPLSAAITPNLDSMVERIYGTTPAYTPQEAESLLEVLFKQVFFILKLCGTIEMPDTLVASSADFKALAQGNQIFGGFMQSLLQSRTLLFLGTPIDELTSYLDILPTFTPTQPHYALVPVTEAGWQTKAEMINKRYAIQVLSYREVSGEDPLAEFVNNLTQTVSRQAKTTTGRSWLKHIRLENIGPFERLELDLNRSWNVLLGDNGVGKSNILRGIAAGILGQAFQPYADRLIRTGATWGQITLQTSNNHVYVTRMEMTSNGIQVTSTGGRPLETESWLVLGYPPTRTVTWSDVKPQVGEFARRPTNDDLLPLVQGDIDPRLDKLKQSFVDLDLRITKTKGKEKTSYQRLLNKYQEIIKQVTGKIKLEYTGILNNHVMFDTDDGRVRIEAVSQGTASLMGWVGFLVERLFEVYNLSRNPIKEYALVLVDEIDAHMHPEWQRQLAGTLEKIFPRVQFIATTHSPLIPVTLAPGNVLRLRRNEENPSQILVERMEEDMRRWEANQVLTSPLFDLGSTVAPEMQQAQADYVALVWRTNLSPEEQTRLDAAAELLKVRQPLAMEREEARLAYQLIQDTLTEKIKKMPAEKQQKILNEARVQMLENVTGSRRSE